MKPILILGLLFTHVAAFSIDSYQNARLADAKIHFEMVLDHLQANEDISVLVFDIVKSGQDKSQEEFFAEIDNLLADDTLAPKTAETLKRAWSNSYGALLANRPLPHDAQVFLQNLHRDYATHFDRKALRAVVYEQTKLACLCNLSPSYITMIQKKTAILDSPPPLESPGPYPSTDVVVVEKDTISLARDLQQEGYHPAALNFANRKNAGGGVVRGSLAQEEDLFRRSAYFLALDPKYNPGVITQGKYRVPVLGVIYSPHIAVVRGSEEEGYPYIEPFDIDFIASAAYDLNDATGEVPDGDEEYLHGMRSKIRAVLRTAAATEHDAVVLGAFGCGAFKNDPGIVAFLFYEVLSEPEFKGQFRKIAFGIIESRKNLEMFQKVLHALRPAEQIAINKSAFSRRTPVQD